MSSSIATKVRECQDLFTKIIQLPQGPGDYQDERERFIKWFQNTGAHQKGSSSLDQRLRDASHIRDVVEELLDGLIESLSYVIEQPENDGDEDIGTSVAGPTQEELQDGVSSIISSLLKLALAVRNPAPLDRYVKSGAIDMSYYKPHDLAYIEEMFPGIDDYLKERMAEATLQRRRFLEYSARHQCKLARDTEIKDDGDDNIDTLSIYASTNASSLPAPILHELSKLEAPDDVRSETSSLTSYASSGMGKRAKVPSPPSYAVLGSSEPFECPYCRLLIAPQDTYGWKRHVFNDLQPYVCTYQECQKQDQLYGSRHEWFDHELAVHRREWVCPGHCNEVFSSLKDFEAHVKTNYAQSDATSSLEVLTIACERPILPSASALCPFCLENVGTRKKIRNHIAQHLMEISLRVLPTSLEDSESSDSDSQPGDDRPKIAFPEVNHDFDVYKLIEWGKASKNLLTSDRRAFVDSLQQVKERLGEVEKLKRMTGVASGNLPNDNESINRAIDDAKESWNNIEKMISSTGTLAGETAGSQAPRESLELRCQQALLDPQIFATQVTALGKSLEAIETRLRISGTNAGPLNNALNDLIPRVVDWKNHDVYSFGKLLLYESSSLIINKSGAKPKTYEVYVFQKILACFRPIAKPKVSRMRKYLRFETKSSEPEDHRVRLAGRIFMDNMTDAVPWTSPGDLEIFWKNEAEVESFTIEFKDKNKIGLWARTIQELIKSAKEVPSKPLQSSEFSWIRDATIANPYAQEETDEDEEGESLTSTSVSSITTLPQFSPDVVEPRWPPPLSVLPSVFEEPRIPPMPSEALYRGAQITQIKARVQHDGKSMTLVISTNIRYQSLVDRIDAKLTRWTTEGIVQGQLKLRYRDEDGDFVGISNDEDLEVAIKETTERIPLPYARSSLLEMVLHCFRV